MFVFLPFQVRWSTAVWSGDSSSHFSAGAQSSEFCDGSVTPWPGEAWDGTSEPMSSPSSFASVSSFSFLASSETQSGFSLGRQEAFWKLNIRTLQVQNNPGLPWKDDRSRNCLHLHSHKAAVLMKEMEPIGQQWYLKHGKAYDTNLKYFPRHVATTNVNGGFCETDQHNVFLWFQTFFTRVLLARCRRLLLQIHRQVYRGTSLPAEHMYWLSE